MKLNLTLKIIIAVIIILSLGIGSGFIGGSPQSQWYEQLVKPSFQPPSWVFGPAWTILYTLMGIAVALIWNMPADVVGRNKALKLFIYQLILNLVWTPLFFGLQRPDIALVIIIGMWGFIFLTIRAFYKLNKTAAYLLIPYIAWVSFATLLNTSIVYLN